MGSAQYANLIQEKQAYTLQHIRKNKTLCLLVTWGRNIIAETQV